MEKFIEWSVSELKKRGLFNFFPKLENEIRSYPRRLQEAAKKNYFVPKIETGHRYQHFEFTIHLPSKDESYKIRWAVDIDRVWNKTINQLPVNQPWVYADKSDLNLERVKHYMTAKEIKPTLAIHFVLTGAYLIIDGNHRFEAARRRGDIAIPAIILEPAEHIPTIESLEMQNKYIIHHNLGMLLNFAHNPNLFLDITTDAIRPERAFYPFNKEMHFPYLRKKLFVIWNALFNRS